ncbi:unnamed protein product [Rotaria sp. Silwood2]|nr:unnamed protein product [Rotaria sp. Silwood2]
MMKKKSIDLQQYKKGGNLCQCGISRSSTCIMNSTFQSTTHNIPRLNIVIQVVGTRGDVQPFIVYGQVLQRFGHRVRLATHEKFADFVLENGLEFYALAGDPDELMNYMVKCGGVFPTIGAILTGEIWTGLGTTINNFRENVLQLPRLRREEAHLMMSDNPHTYCWSPSFVPKPTDWGSDIDVCGFFFLDDAANYQPPQELTNFLNNGNPPIYIGFGSVVGYNRHRLFRIVRDALEITGRRAVVSDSLATDDIELPANIFRCGPCSHKWLFQRVDSVCHHGGAGTTAAGLRAGLPTIVVAFFGDQFFWGDRVEQIGAGPGCLSGDNLNTQDLINAIQFISNPEVKENAQRIAAQLETENGCADALRAFHEQLPLDRMHSDLESTYPACCRIPKYNFKVSWPVAQVLLKAQLITEDELSPWSTKAWNLTESCKLRKLLQYRTSNDIIPYSDEECELIRTRFNDSIEVASQRSYKNTAYERYMTQG